MNLESFSLKAFKAIFESDDGLSVFLRYVIIFFLMLLSLASISLYHIIATQSNPFFYAKF